MDDGQRDSGSCRQFRDYHHNHHNLFIDFTAMTVQEATKIAVKFARSKGYEEKVIFLCNKKSTFVFTITHPQDDDYGQPLAVVVDKNGIADIKLLFDVS